MTEGPNIKGSAPGNPALVLNSDGTAPCVLVCEHASPDIPPDLNALGIPPNQSRAHWVYDSGAAEVTRSLSESLDAPALLARWSRLVVDLNRALDHPTAFAHTGEGHPVPGNESLSDSERHRRAGLYYHPFHRCMSRLIDARIMRRNLPALLSIHSFTPVFHGRSRPWEIGVMWAQDPDLPARLIRGFTQAGFVVGDNEPYDGRKIPGTTLNRHGDGRGLPNALIEVRNDLIATPQAAKALAGHLAPILKSALSDPSVFRYYDGPEAVFDPQIVQTYFESFSRTGEDLPE
jgi:predicted N-formylglutamate amidohydrolase